MIEPQDIDQRQRELQREYLDFLDDEVSDLRFYLEIYNFRKKRFFLIKFLIFVV